ncbi:hypothetical protein HYD_4430 [Candidatus Hydrogenosomobacter endosymbioticus]|uniref:tRNA(Ile)-lysidine synthase n=2 Tax=Candidatus Hydrogenosomobacter endosymbioticus TaxID=2558174 RepID=A0ABN6L336_9PROT|nr:hypothetical protein HYD_4430 [Candidatus Hydrogenosomobacter endosymbioticus]
MSEIVSRKSEKIAVGLSGGVDSSLLTFVLSNKASIHGIEVNAIIIDHGLRGESKSEAESAAKFAQDCGAKPIIIRLAWDIPPKTQLQELARKKRYSALLAACNAIGARHMFIAHHMDDLLETVIMRQQKNSSSRGMAGISLVIPRHNIYIIRPLLAIPKSSILSAAKTIGIRWTDDPSNSDQRFTRAQIRPKVASMPAEEKNFLFLSSRRAAISREKEAVRISEFTGPLIYSCDFSGALKINIEPLLKHDQKEIEWALWHWIQHTGNCSSVRKLGSLKLLWDKIRRYASNTSYKSGPRIISCLGGCMFVISKEGLLYVIRESGRISSSQKELISEKVMINCKTHFFWDRRFFFSTSNTDDIINKRQYYEAGTGFINSLIQNSLPDLSPQTEIACCKLSPYAPPLPVFVAY